MGYIGTFFTWIWEAVEAFLNEYWNFLFLSTFGLLGCFLLFYVVFHLLFITSERFKDVHWKFVDYVWLAAAAIGIATAVNVVKTYELQQVYRTAVKFELGQASVLGTKLSVLAESKPCLASDGLSLDQQQTLKRVCKYYARSTPKDGEDRYRFPSSKTLTSDLEKLQLVMDESFKKTLADSIRSADLYEKDVIETNSAEAELKPSIFYQVFMGLSPLILVMALALRTAKVTGEILLKHPDAFRVDRKVKGWFKRKPSGGGPVAPVIPEGGSPGGESLPLPRTDGQLEAESASEQNAQTEQTPVLEIAPVAKGADEVKTPTV